MPKAIKFGNVVVCEHVVQGANNKHTLINTYGGDIIVRDMPARLSIGLYIEIKNVTDIGSLQFEIMLGAQKMLEVQSQPRAGKASKNGIVIVPLMMLAVEEDTDLKVFFEAEGYRRSRAASVRIFQGEIPS